MEWIRIPQPAPLSQCSHGHLVLLRDPSANSHRLTRYSDFAQVHVFTVDTVRPVTSITPTTPIVVTDGTAVFELHADDPFGSTFRCRLIGANDLPLTASQAASVTGIHTTPTFEPCDEQVEIKDLPLGAPNTPGPLAAILAPSEGECVPQMRFGMEQIPGIGTPAWLNCLEEASAGQSRAQTEGNCKARGVAIGGYYRHVAGDRSSSNLGVSASWLVVLGR